MKGSAGEGGGCGRGRCVCRESPTSSPRQPDTSPAAANELKIKMSRIFGS